MFDIVRNNRRVVQVFLVLIMLPFAFFGVESYISHLGAGDDIAKVGDNKITTQEFRQALREQQERIRASAQGRQIPPGVLDSPEARRAVLDTLINRHLLSDYARKAHFTVSDQALVQFISSVSSLQVDGKFSPEKYDAIVAAQSLTKEAFEARLRQDIVLQQAAAGISASSLTGKTSSALWVNPLFEEREVSSSMLKLDQYLSQVKLAADAAKTYYDAHSKDFEIPAQVRAEFVILSQAALMNQVTVSEADIKAAYDSHQDKYRQGAERRASHILILADKAAPEAKVAEAKAKAEGLLAQLKKNPKDFAKLAKENSQDPGSAAKGGDLDWFARGAMVKPFEEAAFSMKEGEISSVVRSDFGFHIIQLTGIRGDKGKSLADVRGEIEIELKQQAAAKKYAEAAEGFTNTVYEQADSLKPVADKYKLEIQQTGWIAKGVAGNGLASNPKLLAALFSDDAIKNKRNTEAVEVASNTLVSARVVESKPATSVPLADVKDAIEKQLTHEEARKLAIKAGHELLIRLFKGETVNLVWGEIKNISRINAEKMPLSSVDAIFKSSTSKLPSYAGATTPDGDFVLYRISKVTPHDGTGDQRTKALGNQYAQIVASEEFAAWLAALREKAGVEINQKLLETKEEK